MVVTAHRYGTARLTVEGTLAYQLTAARLALACGVAAGEIDAAGSGERIQETIIRHLAGEFGGMLGENHAGLEVEILEAEAQTPRRAAVTLRPAITLEGKSPQLRVDIALEG
jgi:hypothetical protein